jgi:dynein heavy chain
MDYHPYQIPAAMEHQRHLEAINKFKSKDIPAVFGLNNNADLTFRMKESTAMITTLLETMPKDAGGGSGKSLNQEVQEKVEKDYAPMLPADIVWLDVVERLKALRGPRGLGEPGNYDKLPLNVFLSQELQRMAGIMKIVKTTFSNIVMAINGDVIMTPEIVDAINCVADLRVPRPWCYDPSGAEIAWLSPSLPVWIRGLIDRHHQIWQWIQKERPASFWLTGFFNPTGFLTSMKQEVTRQKKTLQWSLDEVEYMSEVTKDTFSCDDGRSEGHNFPNIQEGVLIHGLYLEGAGWHVKEERLDDAAPGERYYPFPVMKVTAVSVGKPEEGKKDQNAQARTELQNRAKNCYRCPLYRYPGRRMPYLIETFYLKADSGAPSPNQQKTMTPLIKWRLCGTALLCSKV